MYRKPIQPSMKLSPDVAPLVGMRIMAVLVICSTFLVFISAINAPVEGQRREEQNSDRVLIDGAEGVEKQTLLHRERRAVDNNSGPNMTDIEKRLKAIEEK